MNLLYDKVKNLPSTPGVYLMKDSQSAIIYVGKSKNLKSRVQSYFYRSKAHSRKVEKLVKTLKDFDFIQTDTEFEAFMLECQLIKEVKPYFNKLMKNPLSYTYIVIKMDEEIHRVEISHSICKNKEHLYFGPFTSKSTIEKTIEGFKDCFKIDCSSLSVTNSPCLNYSIGLCIGMCQGGAALDQYNSIIEKLISFLKRSDTSLLEEMQEKMAAAAESFDFETAAKFRNSIKYLTTLINKERMIEFTEENHNLVMVEHLSEGCFKIFLVKRNKILFSETYSISDENIITNIKINIMKYFRAPCSSEELNPEEIDEAQIIYLYLRSNNCSYRIISDKLLHSENKLENEISKLFS